MTSGSKTQFSLKTALVIMVVSGFVLGKFSPYAMEIAAAFAFVATFILPTVAGVIAMLAGVREPALPKKIYVVATVFAVVELTAAAVVLVYFGRSFFLIGIVLSIWIPQILFFAFVERREQQHRKATGVRQIYD